MAEDLDKPRETSERIAERRWRNNALAKKAKEGKAPIPMMVYPEDIDYVNKKVRVDKNPPPDVATVIENKAKRLRGGFETKFLKEIRSMLDERKRENYNALVAHVTSYRRKLMLEKLRRYELAEREDAERENAEWDAQRRNATKSRDLFA
jgi:hypothetical protein